MNRITLRPIEINRSASDLPGARFETTRSEREAEQAKGAEFMNQQDIELVRREVESAEERIRPYIRETPLEVSHYLGEQGKCRVQLKLENYQLSGSFKIRGALNKYLSLSSEEKEAGVVAASTGNHAAAVANVLERFGGKGVIYLPSTAVAAKVEFLRSLGMGLEFFGNDCIETELFARATALQEGKSFISPYNDIKVVGGQGTISAELERQSDRFDVVFVPVGGGGLAAGVGGYLKSLNRNIQVIGCQPLNSRVMFESIRSGKILEMASQPTLADGTAGGIESDSLTFELCKECIDRFVLLTEDEIRDAIRLILERHQMVIEGAAALPVAAFLKSRHRYKGQNIVLLLTGRRIDFGSLKSIICKARRPLEDQRKH